MVRIETYKGKTIKPYVKDLAQMRVTAFYHFPYLYVGTVEEDAKFSAVYAEEDEALLIIAFEEDEVVGLISGMPFSSSADFIQDWKQQAFDQGVDLENYYYLGELIVKKDFRKKNLAYRLGMRLLEEIGQMNYKNIGGVTSIRSQDHPLYPDNYKDTDQLWSKIGGQKTNVTISVEYPTRQSDGSVKDEENRMSLWVKSLEI